jgi:hypothetical protein
LRTGVLLRLVAHPLIERLHAAHEIARLVDGTAYRVLLVRLAKRRLRIADLVLQRIEVGLDVGLHRFCVVARLAAQRVLGVAHLLAHPLVGDASSGFIEFARRVFRIAARVVRELLELVLQLTELLVHRVLARLQPLRLRVLRGALHAVHSLDFRRNLLLLVGQGFRLTHRILNVALAAAVLIALQLLLRLLDLVERGGRLGSGVA